MPVPERHLVNGNPVGGPCPEGTSRALFGMGCFWGAERKFWTLEGVYTSAVGYAGGLTPNPTYEEVCSGLTGHNEVVLVVFDPRRIAYQSLLRVFWESHDPTQGMRQGNDIGTQYRSGIYPYDDLQRAAARFCATALTGGAWDDAGVDLPSDREESFAFLRSCAEHLRSLLRSRERVAEVRRIERWYRFLDDAAWRVKAMNMNPEACVTDIARSMAAGGEPPMRRQ